MTEQQVQMLLKTMDLDSLKKLKDLYNNYLKELKIISNMQRRIESCQDERTKGVVPTDREVALNQNLRLIRRIPTKKYHSVETRMLDNGYIDFLKIDGYDFNPLAFDHQDYKRMFFDVRKKSECQWGYLIFALVSTILSLVTFVLSITVVPSFAIPTLVLALTSFLSVLKFQDTKKISYIQEPKKNISHGQLCGFAKRLKKDFNKEQIHSEDVYENNLAFSRSIEDICQKSIDMHMATIESITDEIRTFLISADDGAFLTDEEITDAESLIDKGYQKVKTI